MKRRIYTILLCLLWIWIDQWTKYIFYNLKIWNNIRLILPLLNDWISRWIDVPMIIIFVVTILCIGLFSIMYYKKYLSTFEFALLIWWTIGNFIDRVWLGGVRDFISVWKFPVFNFADMMLTCGVVRICIKEIFHLQTTEKNLP